MGSAAPSSWTTTYNAVGLPETLVGAEEYVWGTGYDDRGRPTVRSSGPRDRWAAQHWSYDADQRLAAMDAANPTATVLSHSFSYDKVGNIIERDSSMGAAEWRECFGYDDRHRLTDAFTVDPTASCGSGARGGGDIRYDHSYVHSVDGNLMSRTEDGTTRTLTYPAPGTTRPHAPTGVEGDSYSWDDNGNLVGRTVDGKAETLTWSPEQLLETVDGPDGPTSFVYDPAGQRLLRTTPTETALYLEGHEVKLDNDTGTATATRTYALEGALIATRTADGVSYLFGDQQGSIEVAMRSGDTGPAATRAYEPYGTEIDSTGDGFDTDRGWIGQIEDTTTELSYLNARYYDPTLGRFISPDPLLDLERPQTINPYTYGLGNPSTNTDETGLFVNPMKAFQATVAAAKAMLRVARAITNAVKAVARVVTRVVRTTIRAVKTVANIGAAIRKAQNAASLKAMARANPDPGFWKALNKAGSPGALILQGMHKANPNPGFWKALSRAKSAISSGLEKASAPVKAGLHQVQAVAFGNHLIGILKASKPPPPGFVGWQEERLGQEYIVESGDGRAWRADGGCSTPGPPGDTGASFNFRQACSTHDLGYDLLRFYGVSGYGDGEYRKAIDNLFFNDMKGHCAGRALLVKVRCGPWARTYYQAVAINSFNQDYSVP